MTEYPVPSFIKSAGFALIIFALVAPMAYCTAVTEDGRVRPNDLLLACINAKGEWKKESWSAPYVCVFQKSQ